MFSGEGLGLEAGCRCGEIPIQASRAVLRAHTAGSVHIGMTG